MGKPAAIGRCSILLSKPVLPAAAGGIQVYMHKGKMLLALQAVKRALALASSEHSTVHLMVVRFCQAVLSQVGSAPLVTGPSA